MNGKLTYSLAEAAVLLGVSEPTLRISIRNNRIPHIRIGKSRILIPKNALERYLSEAGAGCPA